MNVNDLPLEEIITRTREDGALLKLDDRWTPHKVYRFILNTTVAEVIVEDLIEEFKKSQIYGVMNGISGVTDDGFYVGFGYKRRAVTQQSGILKELGHLTQDVVMGPGHYDRLNNFATVHVLDLPTHEKIRLIREGASESSLSDKSILVIDHMNVPDTQNAILYLMRAFYSVYQRAKTPSKT